MTDLHELTIIPEGTGMMTIYEIHPVTFPGFVDDADVIWVWDCLFQEIDLETNKLIFQWRASEHHSLDETFRDINDEGRVSNRPWDWYHMNSIQKDESGNYLVSARYTHTITYIDGRSGEIIWILGGKRNAFEDISDGKSKATDIAYQHFARFHNLTEFPVLLANEIAIHPTKDVDGVTKMLVSAFDNGADHEWTGNRPSRGVLIEITYPTYPDLESHDPNAYTANLVQEYFHPAQFVASSQGSMQIIPSEDDADPRLQQAEESACPDEAWQDVTTTSKQGFETEIQLKDAEERFLRVVALDADGNVLGVSDYLDLGWEIGANGILNGYKVSEYSAVQLAMFAICGLMLFVIGYEGFKQFKIWKETRWLGYEKVRLHSDASSLA
ncbi:hypothetical protein D6C86_10150 [Aureobasidium pullulans]|nr:hypothetical protein D6C86_10150 [Aureobasidium pullulans]